MTYINRLKQARKAKGLTQQNISNLIGIPKGTYAGYESGNSEPSINTIMKIIDVLDIDANFLFQDILEGSKEKQLDPHENEIIDKYRTLQDDSKNVILSVLDSFYKRDNNN